MEEKGLKCIGGNARGIKIVMGRKMGNAMERTSYDPRVAVDSSQSSWQTTKTWYQWIKGIASTISRHIPGHHIILVDSFRVHFAHETLVKELKTNFRVHLVALVKNATQFIQPMDQLVIPRMKRFMKS